MSCLLTRCLRRQGVRASEPSNPFQGSANGKIPSSLDDLLVTADHENQGVGLKCKDLNSVIPTEAGTRMVTWVPAFTIMTGIPRGLF